MAKNYKRLRTNIPTLQGIRIEPYGDWEGLQLIIDRLPRVIKEGYTKGAERVCKRILQIARKHIREQGGSLNWPPLSDSTVDMKDSLGLNGGIYVLTGLYYQSMSYWTNNRNIFQVGIKSRVKNKFSGGRISVAQIATILEMGSVSRNIPPRPLWGPSYRITFGGDPAAKRLIIWHIRDQLRKQLNIRVRVNVN